MDLNDCVVIEGGYDGAADLQPGFGDFRELVYWLESLITMLVPSLSNRITITAKEDRHELFFKISFLDPNQIGLFCGKKCCNISLVLAFLRSQQMYPHDRYIHIVIEKEFGDNQHFFDRNVSARRKKK